MTRHHVTLEEELMVHEGQARKLGATVVLIERNRRDLRDKGEELHNWTRWRRSKFFLEHIRRERNAIVSDGLKLEAEKIRLEVELEKARSDVQLLANGGKIVRL